jgi:vitamin B12 transporter
VIQIFTQQNDGSLKYGYLAGYGSFGTSQESLNYSNSLNDEKKTKFSLGFTRENSTGFNTTASNSSNLPFGFLQNATGFNRNSIVGSISHEWEIHQNVGLRFFSSADTYQYPNADSQSFNSGGPPYTGFVSDGVNKFTAISLLVNNQLNEKWISALQITKVFSFNQNIWPKAGAAGSNDSNDMPERIISWQQRFKLDEDVLQLIFERREQSISTQYSFDQSGCPTPSSCNFYHSRTSDSIATAYSIERGSHLVTLSIREDAITGFNNRSNGGLAYGYRFSPGWKGVIDLNTGYRVPTYGDLYYPGISNPNLNPESSKNLEIGVTYSDTITSAKVFVFDNNIHNFIEPASNSVHPSQDYPINIGAARLKGISSGIEIKIGQLRFSSSLDYIQATDKNTGNSLPRISKFASTFKFDFRRDEWDLGASLISSGSTFDDIQNTPSTINTPYVLFNLYGSYKLDKHWTLFTRLNNVLNTQYQTAFGYAMPGFNGFGGVRYAFD